MDNSVRIRDFRRLKNYRFNTEGVDTVTSDEQVSLDQFFLGLPWIADERCFLFREDCHRATCLSTL